MPSVQELYNAYKDKVEFVFISNEKWNTISDFYIKNGYDLPTYTVLSATPNQLKSKTIPATFIIDKKGTIVVEKRGAANWNSNKTRLLLDKLLE